MPILGPSGSPLFTTSTTVQSVMDATARDVRQVINSTTTPDSIILLDYVNRVHLEMLRASRWQFLLSAPQKFITQLGVTDYWIGPAGGSSFGQYDTGLNLSDIRTIKPGTLFDRTNFRSLQQTVEVPNIARLEYADDTPRLGRPAEWRQAVDTPNVLNIYPGPDNQGIFAPQPEPPIWSVVTGGSLPARFYSLTSTYVDSNGSESTAPRPARVFIPANNLLVVNPPQEPLIAGSSGVKYNTYKVYAVAGTQTGTPPSQSCVFQAGPISTSLAWTEPTSGLLTAGANPPSYNAVEPIDGYIIEFRYYKQRAQITTAGQILQVPDDYKDVVISGVNARAFRYLLRAEESKEQYALYRDGISQIIRDINFMHSAEYIKPDPATIGGSLPAVESSDLSTLSN